MLTRLTGLLLAAAFVAGCGSGTPGSPAGPATPATAASATADAILDAVSFVGALIIAAAGIAVMMRERHLAKAGRVAAQTQRAEEAPQH